MCCSDRLRDIKYWNESEVCFVVFICIRCKNMYNLLIGFRNSKDFYKKFEMKFIKVNLIFVMYIFVIVLCKLNIILINIVF